MDEWELRASFGSSLERYLSSDELSPTLAVTAATNLVLTGKLIPDSFWDEVVRSSSVSNDDDEAFLVQIRDSDPSSLMIRTRREGIEPFEVRYAGFRRFRPASKRPDPNATLDMPFSGSFDFANVDSEVFLSIADRGSTYDFLFNKYPFVAYQFLLVPARHARHNQYLDPARDADAIRFAWSIVVGADRGLRLGYNSSGASSSVNQLHFQGYLASEMTAPLESWLASGRTLADWPFRGARFVSSSEGADALIAFVAEMDERFREGEDVAYTLEFFPSGVVCMPRSGERTSAYQNSITLVPYSSGFGFAELAGTIIAQEPSALDVSGRELFRSVIRVYESLRLSGS